MGGLLRICKAHGGMRVTARGVTVHYVYDYVADKAVPDSEMLPGSDRWAASERKRWGDVKVALDAQTLASHNSKTPGF